MFLQFPEDIKNPAQFMILLMCRDPQVTQGEQEENGIRYVVEVYEKIE